MIAQAMQPLMKRTIELSQLVEYMADAHDVKFSQVEVEYPDGIIETYQYEIGMTWEELVNSRFNSDGMYVEGDYVRSSEGDCLCRRKPIREAV